MSELSMQKAAGAWCTKETSSIVNGMKKILFTIIIFMFVAGLALAKEPEYEVTIHVIYNSIPASEIADLIESQLRKHKDACKVEIKIKNPDSALNVISYTDLGTDLGNQYITLTDDNAIYYDEDAASD